MTNYKCRFGCKGKHNSDLHLNASDYQKLTHRTKETQEPKGPVTELANLVQSMDREAADEPDHVFCMAREKPGAKPAQTKKVREMAVTTAIVEVTNPDNGRSEAVYAMIDTGASNTHLSSALGRKLGLRGTLSPFVVGSHGGRVQEYEVMECKAQIGSIDKSYQRMVEVKCYPDPCGHMEVVNWKELQGRWAHLKYLPLPDALSNRRVEMIIGTDCLDAIEAITPVAFGMEGEPCTKLAKLGWIIGGRTTPKDSRVETPKTETPKKGLMNPQREGKGVNKCFFMRELTPTILERDWDIETPEQERILANSSSLPKLTRLEKAAVEKFERGVKKEKNRYTVPLMWKESERPPNNYDEARKIFLRQEVKMNQDPNLKLRFQENIAKWLANEWADLVPLNDTRGFYIPTFMVIKTDRATTKYRLIMNGAYEFHGQCINDFLMPGPSRMNKVWDVMMKSRRKLYLLACDVESMFLNIRVSEEQQDPLYLRALFRDPKTAKIRAVQCKTHVFGLNQSPYVAMEVVQRHAEQLKGKYPYAVAAVQEDIIVDDVIHASDSKLKIIKTQQELVAMFQEASMRVHKWVTNLPELWATLPEESKAQSYSFSPEEDELFCDGPKEIGPSIKALGVLYHAPTDQFQFFAPQTPPKWTMRTLSSYVMQLYDPLELLSPIFQKGQRLVQLLWRMNCKWDEPLEDNLAEAAEAYVRMLADIHRIHIPRCIRRPLDVAGWEIICFVDASSHTMASCLYQRTLYVNGTLTSQLICSKMKLVPIKKQESIPRAETQAGVIGVKLAFDLAKAYRVEMEKFTFFSDSTTLLWWLRTKKPLSIYVANRICQILDRTSLYQWKHVRTFENPADIPTRGARPNKLAQSPLWWEGPKFLKLPREKWVEQPKILPTLESECEESSIREIVSNLTFLTVEKEMETFEPAGEALSLLVGKFAPLQKGLNIATLVCHFLTCVRNRGANLNMDSTRATVWWTLVRYDQEQTFRGLKKALETTGRVPNSLAPLRPFVGPNGEIRSCSRLQNLPHLEPETKKPIILHKESKLAEEVLREIHSEKLKHCGGINTLLAEANRKYHIMRGRNAACRVLKTCPWCLRRTNPKPLEVASVSLHPNRGGLSMRSFAETGVDMAGPFLIKHGKTRAKIKVYCILFVCCATRAVNIEAVEEASTASCRMAFDRHCSRYGPPEKVYSDNGKNFVGLHNSLRNQYEVWIKSANALQEQGGEIERQFTPPYSPRWNGQVEVMVKIFKQTLRKLLSNNLNTLRTEEFYTLCTLAAGYMNRRPLVQIGTPGDREVLTPAHFLLAGNPYLGFGPRMEPGTSLATLKGELERIADELWKRLEREYIKAQAKFAKEGTDLDSRLERGDLVLILTERTAKGLWPIGTVLEAREGKDHCSRKFRIRLKNKVELIRSASFLAPIKIDKALNDQRLTFSPKPFRGGWLERTKNRWIEEKQARALKLLTSRMEYEEARRMFALCTGQNPDKVLCKGRKKNKNNKLEARPSRMLQKMRLEGTRRARSA